MLGYFFCLMSIAESSALKKRLPSCLSMYKPENDHKPLPPFQAAVPGVMRASVCSKRRPHSPTPHISAGILSPLPISSHL